MKIPESISAMVYSMKHPALWTLMVWAIAAVGYWLMAGVLGRYIPLAFAVLACMVFVGAMPLLRHEENTKHYIFAAVGGVLSQLWCILVAGFWWIFLWWWLWCVVMIVLLYFGKARFWCLLIELWAMAAAVWTIVLIRNPDI